MFTEIISLMAVGFGILFVMMTGLWAVNVRRNNAAIVDVGWGAGYALMALVALTMADGYGPRRVLIATLVGIWGLRLALHLFVDRVLPGKPEDGRYVALRKKWGTNVNRKFFVFFQTQAVMIAVLSLPIWLMAINRTPELLPLEYVGAALWLVGVLGESVADGQLKRFKDDPANKGKTCRVGLWNFSRHPNYFFEWVIWISYAVMALTSPYGWAAVISPAVMLYVLLNVTGIPLTEEQALRTKGDDYRDYQRTTSKFIPWFKGAQ